MSPLVSSVRSSESNWHTGQSDWCSGFVSSARHCGQKVLPAYQPTPPRNALPLNSLK
ncbi:MAG: hypothetical protein R2856_29485 [Caldilineaceae bacterium]